MELEETAERMKRSGAFAEDRDGSGVYGESMKMESRCYNGSTAIWVLRYHVCLM